MEKTIKLGSIIVKETTLKACAGANVNKAIKEATIYSLINEVDVILNFNGIRYKIIFDNILDAATEIDNETHEGKIDKEK